MSELLNFDEYTILNKIKLTLKKENIPHIEEFKPLYKKNYLDYAIRNIDNDKKLFVEVKKIQGFRHPPFSYLSKIRLLKDQFDHDRDENNNLLVILIGSNLDDSYSSKILRSVGVDYLINPTIYEIISKIKSIVIYNYRL